MNEYYLYETKKGDRWDIIANKFLGDMYKLNEIIAENPHVQVADTIEEGTVLRISKKNNSNSINLPIWIQER